MAIGGTVSALTLLDEISGFGAMDYAVEQLGWDEARTPNVERVA